MIFAKISDVAERYDSVNKENKRLMCTVNEMIEIWDYAEEDIAECEKHYIQKKERNK